MVNIGKWKPQNNKILRLLPAGTARQNNVPAGKIAEKAVWRSVFLTIWHCILNADSTKTHSSVVTYPTLTHTHRFEILIK